MFTSTSEILKHIFRSVCLMPFVDVSVMKGVEGKENFHMPITRIWQGHNETTEWRLKRKNNRKDK